MNAAEHVTEAERLVNNANRELQGASPNTIKEALEVHAASVAAAQVHATLAVAYTLATALMPLAELATRNDIAGRN